MPAIRAFSVQRFALELDGVHAGFLSSFEGGHAVADVVADSPIAPSVQPKHLGPVRYEDITVTCGAGMGVAFWKTLQAVLAGDRTPRDGAIVSYDQSFAERTRLAFDNALISEIGFPKLDASAKDAALLTITLTPEQTRRSGGSGAKAAPAGKQPKALLRANFKIAIDGADDAASKASTVHPLTVAFGPAGVEVPDLVLGVAQSAAGALEKWHEDAVINGNAKERSGSIELLSADLKQVLLRLELTGLEIFALAYDRGEAGAEAIAKATASMYCEQITLATFPGAP